MSASRIAESCFSAVYMPTDGVVIPLKKALTEGMAEHIGVPCQTVMENHRAKSD
jgi:hypothetical protein